MNISHTIKVLICAVICVFVVRALDDKLENSETDASIVDEVCDENCVAESQIQTRMLDLLISSYNNRQRMSDNVVPTYIFPDDFLSISYQLRKSGIASLSTRKKLSKLIHKPLRLNTGSSRLRVCKCI